MSWRRAARDSASAGMERLNLPVRDVSTVVKITDERSERERDAPSLGVAQDEAPSRLGRRADLVLLDREVDDAVRALFALGALRRRLDGREELLERRLLVLLGCRRRRWSGSVGRIGEVALGR